jgi:hypothetical protein
MLHWNEPRRDAAARHTKTHKTAFQAINQLTSGARTLPASLPSRVAVPHPNVGCQYFTSTARPLPAYFHRFNTPMNLAVADQPPSCVSDGSSSFLGLLVLRLLALQPTAQVQAQVRRLHSCIQGTRRWVLHPSALF